MEAPRSASSRLSGAPGWTGDTGGIGIPPLSKEGSAPIPPMTPVQLGAPDNLVEALRGASIVDEHCILMGTVIEKVQSAKSGLNEACNNLLTGFEVSHVEREHPVLTGAPETLSGVRKEMPHRGLILFRRLI